MSPLVFPAFLFSFGYTYYLQFFSDSSSLVFKVRRWAIGEAHRRFFHGEGRAGH